MPSAHPDVRLEGKHVCRGKLEPGTVATRPGHPRRPSPCGGWESAGVGTRQAGLGWHAGGLWGNGKDTSELG
eukprot:15434558-Alexandrium_andersonii.AAC.1